MKNLDIVNSMFPNKESIVSNDSNKSGKKNQITQTECLVLDSPYITQVGDSPSFMTNFKDDTTIGSTQE